MRLLTEDTNYTFSPSRYEQKDLGDIGYDVEVLDTHGEVFEAFTESGSCIEVESEAVQQGYAEVFAEDEDTHFYSIGDQGYARSIEFSTDQGEALAVDAVKTGKSFDPEAYRAGINSIFRHAESMDKDMVLGGNMVFKHRWEKDLDLRREKEETVPADELYFQEEIPAQDLNPDTDSRPYDKGEKWEGLSTFFMREL